MPSSSISISGPSANPLALQSHSLLSAEVRLRHLSTLTDVAVSLHASESSRRPSHQSLCHLAWSRLLLGRSASLCSRAVLHVGYGFFRAVEAHIHMGGHCSPLGRNDFGPVGTHPQPPGRPPRAPLLSPANPIATTPPGLIQKGESRGVYLGVVQS